MTVIVPWQCSATNLTSIPWTGAGTHKTSVTWTGSGIHKTSVTWTGAPGSPWRTWAEKDGAKPNERFLLRAQVHNLLKAIETFHFRPRYAEANLGHPSGSY
jgi:hypothetical protein